MTEHHRVNGMNLTLVSREDLCLRNLLFATYISRWQDSIFNNPTDIFSVGEEVFLEFDEDQPTTLSEEQALQLNMETAADNAALCDNFEFQMPRFSSLGEVIAEFPASDGNNLSRYLGEKTKALVAEMGWDEVLVIPLWRSPFLKQRNDYPPVERATNQLMNMGLTPEYSGGVVLNEETVQTFFEHMFWIVRCNASVADIVFSGVKSSVFGMMCHYGNIHFECGDEQEKQKLLKATVSVGLDAVQGRTCNTVGAIEGRDLELE